MKRPRWYILQGHETAAAPDIDAWVRWMEERRGSDPNRVDFTDLGYCTVSTVFLGVDHRIWGEGPPVLFETMVFANPSGAAFPDELDDRCQRYCTWDEAVAGHAEIVAEVRQRFWKRANDK